VNLSKTSLRGGQIDCGPQCAALDGQCKLGLEGIVSKRKDSMYRSLFDKQSPGNPLGDALKGLTNLSSLNQTHNLGERWLRHRGTPCNFCPTEARRHPRRTADQIRSCTGVGENGRAIAFHVLVKPQAKANFGQHTSKRGLADLKRITPQIVAVQLDQVESVEEGTAVMAVVANEIERGNAVIIAGDSFTVDNAGARAQADAAESDG